jgi:hypothetical protein
MVDRVETGIGAVNRVEEREKVNAAEKTAKLSFEQTMQIGDRPPRSGRRT